MDASDLHTKKTGNLLSQIAADPEMINRPLQEPKAEVVAPADQLAASPTAPPIVLLHPDEHLPAPVPAKGHKLVLFLIVAGIFLTVSGGGAAAYFKLRPNLLPAVATATQTPTATPTPSSLTPSDMPSISPTPSDTPSATPTPSVSPTPSAAPAEVSAPAAAPTAEHPQMVTVTNANGLWLRSSPSSASKKNIIAWMPKGAQVSVDSVGEFWWHGTYNGKTGYFAVSYTR